MKKFATQAMIAILLLLSTTLAVFLILELLPFDVIEYNVKDYGPNREQILADLRIELGYDKPVITRYFNWVSGVIRGDFGILVETRKPVINAFGIFLWRTLALNGSAFLIALIVSIPLGMFSATKKDQLADRSIMLISTVFSSVPAYIIGLLVIFNLARYVDWLPISGMRSVVLLARGYDSAMQELLDILWHMIQPVFAMTLVMLGYFVPYVRNALLEVLDQDYIRTARAKGVPGLSLLYKHALKNALIPLLAFTAMQLPSLLMSNIFIEAVFRWPGMGLMLLQAIFSAEVHLISTLVLFYTIMTIGGNWIAEGLSGWIDPRIKAVS